MISTKTYSLWGRDPEDDGRILAFVQRDFDGVPANFSVQIPWDPAKPLDPNKPIKVRYVYRKIVRVWQP